MILVSRFMSISVALAFITLSSAGAALARTCAPEHKEAVIDVINQFFEAASHDDDNLFKEILAPGFYAFDNGKRFDGMQLPQMIKAAHGAGKTFVWSVNDPEVHIACDWAWISYTNRGSVGDASGTQPMSWLESAMLHYQGQRWHIQFLHSTRAAPPTSN